jgi:hypothetical protein
VTTLERYLELEAEMLASDGRDADAVRDEMDKAWRDLTDGEIDYLNGREGV